MHDDILEILREIRPDINYESEKHLLSGEVFDSFDVISILSALSEKYNIEIDPDDVKEEFFDDIYGIEKLVSTIMGR
jgi:acyl carrier protein